MAEGIRSCRGGADQTPIDTKERDKEIRKRYLYCQSIITIADEYGITALDVLRICKDLSEKRMRNQHIRQSALEGVPGKELARQSGLSQASIYLICNPPIPSTPEEQMTAEVRKRYAYGHALTDIAADNGLNVVQVSRICNGLFEQRARSLDIRARYASGESQVAIAKNLGRSPAAISLICKGVEQASPITERNAEIRRRFIAGESKKALAKYYGLGLTMIHIICKGLKNASLKEKRDAEIRKLVMAGEKQKDVAERFGLAPETICRICKDLDPKGKRDEAIREKYASGTGLTELAKEFRLGVMRLSQIIRVDDIK
ncbi:MAG: hypothetical protein AB1295_03220 [Candidatus Micrarchaeota archaeon]